MTIDRDGRPYANIAQVGAGTRLQCDGGFDCMREHEIKIVVLDPAGKPFISCDHGQHFLDGQVDDEADGSLIGLYDA